MNTIYNYVLFPENLYENINADSFEKFKCLIKDFVMALDLADCESGSKLYYSKSNKDVFLENLKTFEDISELIIGSYDIETFVNTLFYENNIFAIDEDADSSCIVKTYNSMQCGLDTKIPFIFFDIVKKYENLNELDKLIVLNLFNSYFSQNPILIIIDCNKDVKTLNIPFVTDFTELDNWLIINRIRRNFNKEDNRHIENHPQSKIKSHNKSPLIGGIGGKQNAEDLLLNAIGDRRNLNNKLDLMNYDSTNNAYIWYEDENADNQYHAYHLVKSFSYEKDEIAINRISKRVLKILDYRISKISQNDSKIKIK